MCGDCDGGERRRPVRRCEEIGVDGRREDRAAVVAEYARPTRPGRCAPHVPEFELRKANPEPPGACPLHPAFVLPPVDACDVIRLIELVVDRTDGESCLESQRV